MKNEPLYKQKKFFLTNTLSGKKEEFKTLEEGKVRFYSCGPTVYGALHIGNARALLYADLMFRWLCHIGYHVQFVRNYTDVDDKIINKAIAENKKSSDVAQEWIDYCEKDLQLLAISEKEYKSLGIHILKGTDKTPLHQNSFRTVTVTESIEDIVGLIDQIVDRGHGYVVDGEVFYSIDSYKTYGRLSGKKVEDLQAGARVGIDQKKKNPADFTLWKPRKKDVAAEPFWNPKQYKSKNLTVEGRPGWHIECSAMILKHMGETIDLHHGGQDLIFPHHENEIAQSEGGTGKPFCKHWVHHAFLTAGNEKMSKSLGNILTIREFIEKYSAEVLKYLYLSFHYRTAVPYTHETLEQVLGELERIYNAKAWAEAEIKSTNSMSADLKSETEWKKVLEHLAALKNRVREDLFNDLNTVGAIAQFLTVIREINRIQGLKLSACLAKTEAAKMFLSLLSSGSDFSFPDLFGVFEKNSAQALTELQKIRERLFESSGKSLPSEEEILALIEERKQSRLSKNFARSDEIRKDLEARGVILIDSPQGTSWRVK